MGHLRKRFLQKSLDELLKFSPLIGVLGHRQVGKTTLLTSVCQHYSTLDDKELLSHAQTFPKEFLAQNKGTPAAIDECQLAPNLFPALKEYVRVHKKPGQFILSGSVRFTSRRAIRESLTGRIMNLELLPFTISEIHHQELSQLVPKLVRTKNLENFILNSLHEMNLNKALDKEIDRYLECGGLPGLFFVRNKKLRDQKMNEQLTTILDRDLRLVYPTTLPFTQLLDYIAQLSLHEGKKLNLSQLRSSTGITELTQKKILYALEAVFIIRRLPIQSGEKGFVIYFEDQAEALHLSRKKDLLTQLEGLIYRHIRAPFNYQIGHQCRFFHYSTRGGARVPICLEFEDHILGFIPILEDLPTASHKAIARSFLKTFNNSKIVFLRRKARPHVIDSRTCLLPISAIL